MMCRWYNFSSRKILKSDTSAGSSTWQHTHIETLSIILPLSLLERKKKYIAPWWREHTSESAEWHWNWEQICCFQTSTALGSASSKQPIHNNQRERARNREKDRKRNCSFNWMELKPTMVVRETNDRPVRLPLPPPAVPALLHRPSILSSPAMYDSEWHFRGIAEIYSTVCRFSGFARKLPPRACNCLSAWHSWPPTAPALPPLAATTEAQTAIVTTLSRKEGDSIDLHQVKVNLYWIYWQMYWK